MRSPVIKAENVYTPYQHDLRLANMLLKQKDITITEQAETIAQLKAKLTEVTAERDEYRYVSKRCN